MMWKSIHTKDYAVFIALLFEARQRLGLSQDQLAKRLPFQQVGISKIERGRRRVDVIELKIICDSLGITLGDFVSELESRLVSARVTSRSLRSKSGNGVARARQRR
jgi:transcriptional regulator with XRE-family HTH domain